MKKLPLPQAWWRVGLSLWAAGIALMAQTPSLHINEFVCLNLPRVNDPNAPVDMDGEYPDWLELKNNTGSPIDLTGYGLSDDPAQPGKWRFVGATLPANGYLLVFASGKNRAIAGVQPHTSFRLRASGYLVLSAPSGQVIHSFPYDNQRQTVSFGFPNNSPTGAMTYLTRPTPGAANNAASAVNEFCKDTKFSVDRGFYTNAFTLQITSETPGATIAYTLNGSEPTPTNGFQVPAANGQVAPTATVQITRTTLVRARAWKTGLGSSDVDTQSYIFLQDVLTQNGPPASMNLSPSDTLTWGTTGGNLSSLSAFPGLTFWGVNPQIVNDSNPTNRFGVEHLKDIAVVSLVMDWRHLWGPNSPGQTDGGIYPPASGVANEGVDRAASLELINPKGDPVDANAERGFQINGNVHIFGGTSQDRWKSYKLSMRFQCAGDAEFPLYEKYGKGGATKFSNFILDARINNTWNHPDPNTQGVRGDYVNDQVVADLQNAVSGRGGWRSRPVHLFLNGLYWGLYSLHERPDHHFAESYYGGDASQWDVFKHSVSSAFTESDPLVNTMPANPAQPISRNNATVITNYEYMLDLVGVGYIAPNPAPDLSILTNYEAVARVLDIDDFIDYMIVNYLAGNWDWSDKNLYATYYRGGDGKWRFHSWDSEHTFRTGSENFLTGNGNETPRLGQPKGIDRKLRTNPEYRLRFADRIRKHLFNDGALTVTGMSNIFAMRFSEIDNAIRGESARWGHIRASARSSPNTNIPFKRQDWLARVRQMLVSETGSGPSLLQNRWNMLMAPAPAAGSFRTVGYYPNTAAPDFSRYSGAVPLGFQLTISHTNAGGVIYYTTDGTDPRVYGSGAVAPTARAYDTPLTLNSPTLVKARVWQSGEWSALTEAMYYTEQDLTALVITEVMYNPLPEGITSGDEFEFLELKNVGTNTLNLSGLAFTEGISFTFTNNTRLAPGQFFLLVRNPEQFARRYPGVTIHGVFSGRLDNGGERLRLVHEVLGTTLLSFNYNDREPWPVTPDGFGFALVLKNPAARPDLDDAQNWRASTQVGGSPGADDPATPILPVLVNEVLSAPVGNGKDFIELYNPNSVAVNLEGWFITDAPSTPMKYRIPAGTVIPAGGYWVFTEDDFNPTPGTNNSFGLGALGDAAYLFSGDAATNLTGYSHGFNFGAAVPGVTFGRYVNSLGREQFVRQIQPTPGAANAGPQVGPVVIAEIMYHPPDIGTNDNSRDEFIELANISGAPVPLYDAAAPTNTWRLGNAVDYSFPPDTVLQPGERVLVVNFDPVNDPLTAAVFRQGYSMAPDTRLFGPYGGKLDNSDETIELLEPVLSASNEVGWAEVERVAYRDRAPWPGGADGSGASLQRVRLSAYGNDPTNWVAAMPSAGQLLPSGTPPAIIQQPLAQTVVEMNDATFLVQVTGTGPFTYLWRRNGVIIATNYAGLLTLENVRPEQAGDYSVIVLGAAGVVVSADARLTVVRLPQIVAQPVGTNILIGGNATLSVSAVSDYALRYQWFRDGITLVGATNATLVITNVQIEHEGNYQVAVTDQVGTRLSDVARVQPLRRIAFVTTLPSSLTVTAGVDVVFSAAISGYPPPFTYRFQKVSTTLEEVVTDATNITFTLRNVVFTNAGIYRILALNLATSNGLSTLCNLTVVSWPFITAQPTNVVVNPGSNATFAVTAVGTGTLTYQWYYNGTNLLAGAVGNSLLVTNAQVQGNAGAYHVVISNAYGVVTSEVATLTVRQPAFIVQDLADVTVAQGGTASFNVVAGGGGPYTYTWYFNGSPLVSGASSSLTLNPVQSQHAGNYQVIVSNALGTAASRVARLTLGTNDANGNGIPDAWEAAHGLTAEVGNGRNDDPDGDGATNWEEYIAGTHPLDATSVLRLVLRGGNGSGAELTFTAMPNVGYTILYQTNLNGVGWARWTNIAPQPGTNLIRLYDPAATAERNRFYRIATPPLP
ncbi:lamin tail domain-containing protein [Fontisphaera persica]|uniref:immunoglobulin domain-containing protein n=1 Tax=Fontisphaera persica TaxID=2974023 RepID=UPI0024C07F68|nr:lamin tail domain-containing protein [Fontisphaera persica]WCJ58941.1 lamin tail domain-containing protein [Fontisphaera persica]